jgi:ribosomal protein S21
MITIKLKPNDHFERAITKLKNTVIREGLYKLKREEAARQRVKDLHKDIRAALKDEENFLQ